MPAVGLAKQVSTQTYMLLPLRSPPPAFGIDPLSHIILDAEKTLAFACVGAT